MNIDWSNSFILTAEEVALLGIDGISINDRKEEDKWVTSIDPAVLESNNES
jgi:hypothetical protein